MSGASFNPGPFFDWRMWTSLKTQPYNTSLCVCVCVFRVGPLALIYKRLLCKG
uniref:Uncharacterized protein n=1 Tax=Anguilla anguilla TaxID=7936 RepID=A0A0E9WPE1_ANGAN